MGFMSKLFGGGLSNETLWKRSLVKDLILLSAIDGEIDQSEIEGLIAFCVELRIDSKDFVYVLQNLETVQSVYPDSLDGKKDYILSLIKMTYSDGYIDDNEVELMQAIAQNMGFNPKIITDTIQAIEDSIN